VEGDLPTDKRRKDERHTAETLKVVKFWAFSHRYFLVLTTNGELYKVTTHKPYRLSPLEQPLDLGWTPTELATLLAKKNTPQRRQELQLLLRQRKYPKIFRKAVPLSQPPKTTNNTDFINAFIDIVKKQGMTAEEAFVITRETFVEMEEETEREKAIEEYMKTEEYEKFEENIDAWAKEEESKRTLWAAFSEWVKEQGITQEKALELLNESIQV
jgi:hypothetical protein